ncbi:hypothetical protein JW930_04050 [Candidatus Woesearchaeota archaeon]|nr:hypothetical protein [Candidatus Woesearchaeota archaeon]
MEEKKIPRHVHTASQTPEKCLICQGKGHLVRKRQERRKNFIPDFRNGKRLNCPECGKKKWRFDKKNLAVCTECGFVVVF